MHDLYTEYGVIFEQRNPFLCRRRDKRYRVVLQVAERALGRTGSLLDVGCSTGGFLAVAKEAGWDPEGIELDESAALIAARRTSLPVRVGSGVASLPPNETFDLICMNHFIEHVREPGQEVAAAASHLRRGGLLLVRTPNGGSRVPQVFGSLWSWFTPPTHLTYFREQSFEVLADRSGLAVQARRIWRGESNSTPFEIALVLLRGLSGTAGYSRFQKARRGAEGARVNSGLKLLDSSTIVQRMFSRFDDCELFVLLRNPRSGV